MSCGRSECLVVSSSPDKMMIVGGVGSSYELLKNVLLCDIFADL